VSTATLAVMTQSAAQLPAAPLQLDPVVYAEGMSHLRD